MSTQDRNDGDPTVVALTAAEHDTLRRAQLAQTIGTLRGLAGTMQDLHDAASLDAGVLPDDVATQARLVRDDLDAIAALDRRNR